MKILASDLDGTLFREQEINKDDISALKKLKDNGHKFIISTGRSLRGVKRIFENYNDVAADYLVLCNGSLVLDKDLNTVYKKYIKADLSQEIIKEFIDNNDVCFYFDDGRDTYIVEGNYVKEDAFNIEEFASKVLKREEAINRKGEYQIMSVFPKDKSIESAELIKEQLIDKYGEDIEVFRNQYFLDMAPKGCSKGIGLKMIIESTNLDVSSLYTIGDSLNDISMFEITNNSYTFNHAEEKIKMYAKNHVDYVHECINQILEA